MILQEKNFHMVKVYDNVIPSKACKSFIDLFENNESHQEYIDYNGCPCFTQLNLNQLSPNIVRTLIPHLAQVYNCLLYTSPSPRDVNRSRMPSSA